VVIGANTRLEIWDTAAWEAYLADREQAFADLEEEVLPGVL
jgi:MraZ protein